MDEIAKRNILRVILKALVKKDGGELIVTEKEMIEVKSDDALFVYYEKENGNLILKIEELPVTNQKNPTIKFDN